MAILAGANSGSRGAHGASDAGLVAPYYGVSVAVATTTTPVNIALPTDANGNLYPAYYFIGAPAAFFCFCTTNTDVLSGSSNTYIATNPVVSPIATPQPMLNKQVGAFVSVATLTGAGYINIIGTF